MVGDIEMNYNRQFWNDNRGFNEQYPNFFASESGSPSAQGLQSPLANQFAQINPSLGNQAWPFPDFYVGNSPMVQYNPTTTKKSSSGRKPSAMIDVDDEDDEKRMKRRQRNKEAAARCRQRRLDLMADLQKQVDNYRARNRQRETELENVRKQINALQNFISTHDCKMSPEQKKALLSNIAMIPPPTHLVMPQPPMPRRSDSAMMSIVSGSTGSSGQSSPTEDYKPTIDQLKQLPPIASIKRPAPPVAPRNEDRFVEPEPKIPKIEHDRVLASLASNTADDVERPSTLPMLPSAPTSTAITTPSRPFQMPALPSTATTTTAKEHSLFSPSLGEWRFAFEQHWPHSFRPADNEFCANGRTDASPYFGLRSPPAMSPWDSYA
ncbi:unnamed protein product [Caenorhabditis bovis]|uniref:BZIP domain-containing protein n=1 Tax=Caenorhabditis bovis TaxID=2654633 RepID=A0A8S1EDB8_9PELO|nr:unnamed protein product [Caenorhabditis bovis]